MHPLHPSFALGPWHVESWTLLGRLPLVLMLVALAASVYPRAGLRRALLAMSGAAAGLALGVAFVPSVLGGFAGMLVGGAITLWVIRAPSPGAIPVATALLALTAAGRIGCLLNGCCFGMPTTLPWGARYPAGTMAAIHHHAMGWVGEGAGSLPVHPVPLYELLVLLVLLALLPLLARRLHHAGAAALAVAGLYLAWRAGIDPWRGMVNTASSLVPAGPMSRFQWGALAAAMACFPGAWFVRRRSMRAAAGAQAEAGVITAEPPWERLAAVWAVQLVATVVSYRSMTPILEVVSVAALALSAAVLSPGLVLAPSGRPIAWRLAVASLVAVALPLGLRAAEPSWSDEEAPRRAWVYAADEAGSGKVVRVGEAASARELTAALSLGRGSFPTKVGCGGPSGYVDRTPARLGVTMTTTTEASDAFRSMLQLKLDVFGDAWTRTDAAWVDNGQPGGVWVESQHPGFAFGALAGGLAVWEWRYAALGLGAGVGYSKGWDSRSGPWFGLDCCGVSGRLSLVPGVYLRLGPRSFSLDLGTTAPYQPLDAPVVALAMRPGTTTWRIGLNGRYWPTPLYSSDLFLDGEFEAGGGRWGVRLGLPLAGYLVGTVRYSTAF